MKKTPQFLTVAVGLGVTVLFLVGSSQVGTSSVFAQEQLQTQPSNQVQTQPAQQVENVSTTTIKGQITRKDANQLTIKTDEGVKQVTIPANISIYRNGNATNFDNLKVNDHVSITYDAGGQLVRTEATSESVVVSSQRMLIGIGILAIALVVGYTLWKKSKQPHIKTAVGAV
jgi:hypothetical protein